MSLFVLRQNSLRAALIATTLGLFALSWAVPSNSSAQTPPNRRPANAANVAIPAESKATVDVLGMKLGKSSAADIQAVLKGVTPQLAIAEQPGWLVVKVSKSGMKLDTRVPNSEYLNYISGTTLPFRSQCQDAGGGRGNCEFIFVYFSLPPPAPGVAVAVHRQFLFSEKPRLQNVVEGLVQKYGEPGFQSNYNNSNVEFTFIWAWDFAGKPIRVDAQHPCANNNSFITVRDPVAIAEHSKPALQRGCAAYLQIKINADNGLATMMRLHARDHFATYAAALRAQAFAATAMANSDQDRLNRASGAPVPKN